MSKLTRTTGKIPEIMYRAGEVTLNLQEVADITEMVRLNPTLHVGLEATRGWELCHAPKVTWPKLGTKAGKELQHILEEYYVGFRWECYRRIKMFGYVAYYYKTVRGWRYPVHPPLLAGYINIFFDYEKEETIYRFYWSNRPSNEHVKKMRFEVWYEPTLDGLHTSPLMTAIRAWKRAKLTGTAGEHAVHHGSRIPYFLQYSPPKIKPGDEKVSVAFGDDEELELERDTFDRQLERQQMSRNALRAGVMQARMANQGFSVDQHRTPVLNSETVSEREEREGNGVLDRIVELDAYWSVARTQPPVLVMDPIATDRRMDEVAAMVLEFPIGMLVSDTARRAADFEGNMRVASDRMKALMTRMDKFIRSVILEAEQARFQKLTSGMAKKVVVRRRGPITPNELFDLEQMVTDLRVEQPCTPLVSLETLEKLWELGLMNQDRLAYHAGHTLNIPLPDMQVTKILRPAELERIKAGAEKRKVDNDMELGREQIAADLKKTKMMASAKPKPSSSSSGSK